MKNKYARRFFLTIGLILVIPVVLFGGVVLGRSYDLGFLNQFLPPAGFSTPQIATQRILNEERLLLTARFISSLSMR